MSEFFKIYTDPKSGKKGIINDEGVFTLYPDCDKIIESHGDYFWVLKWGTWVLMNCSGNIVFNLLPGEKRFPIEKHLEIDDNNVCLKVAGKWFLIDRFGSELTPLEFDEIDHFHLGPMLQKKVKKNNLWAICDNHLNPITPFKYKKIDVIIAEGDYASVIDNNDNYAFIDKNGKLHFESEYEFVDSFFDGLAIVSKDDKYGAIDRNGQIVIPMVYDYLENNFSFIHAEKDGYFWSIDYNGVLIPEHVVEKVDKLNQHM